MTRRRIGTRPHHTFWTPEGVTLIEEYQARHDIPSFSAAAEALVRMGLERSPSEYLEPLLISTIRQTIRHEVERFVRLQLATALNTEMAWRFAAATLRDVGRTMTDEQRKSEGGRDRYYRIKQYVMQESRRQLGRDPLRALTAEIDSALAEQPPAAPLAEALDLEETIAR